MKFSIAYSLPSQNQRDVTHWRVRSKQNKLLRDLVYYHSVDLPRATGPRLLTLTSYRRQRIKDDANLRGGAKSLVDALVHARLLVDDDDKHVRVTYLQATLSKLPAELLAKHGRRPVTVIELRNNP